MMLRAVGRRASTGSVTVLGDLAQATTPCSTRSWRESLAHLGHPDAAVTNWSRPPRDGPDGLSDSRQERVAHGVVAWARSPSTVTEPVLARRPTARSIIGDRSWASSTITCPRLGVRCSRSAASSIKIRSASDQRAAANRAGRPAHPDQLLLVGGQDLIGRRGPGSPGR